MAPDAPDLRAQRAPGDDPIPSIVREVAAGRRATLVWRNDLGGLTFRIADTYLKWNPPQTGVDLERERRRLDWISLRHPAPRVLEFGWDGDAQWMLTAAVPGESAVGDTWRARRSEAIRAIAAGLRALHALPVDDFPAEWASEVWVGRTPSALGPRPPVDQAVLVHGDACAPNTLISADGRWTGNVDFGDLTVGDPWADLAVASMSLDWNFGEGHQDELFEAYGISPDPVRIGFYRALWHLES
jgi:kanamycin kinase